MAGGVLLLSPACPSKFMKNKDLFKERMRLSLGHVKAVRISLLNKKGTRWLTFLEFPQNRCTPEFWKHIENCLNDMNFDL